jgi:hypothetical protein
VILRALAVSAGLLGAAGASQFPEFSQQYRQRLGGAVDELALIVVQFDIDAAVVGLDRETALAQLATGGVFGARRAETLRGTFARYNRLREDLAALEGAGPFERARMAPAVMDREIARRTLSDYVPAMPLSLEGLSFAAIGFGMLTALVGLSGRAMRRLLLGRWRRRAA